MNAQETANNILVDLDAESQRDLLSDAGTAPARIPTFHGNDGVDEVFLRSLRARPTPALGRKQHAVLSLLQHTVEMQQSGRLQNDGGTENACPAHEKGAQAGDDPIGGMQVGCPLAAAIEDQQLMPDQHGFGNNGTEAARLCQSRHGDDQMNEQDEEVAHPGNGISTSRTTAFRPIWQFAMDTVGAFFFSACRFPARPNTRPSD